MHPASRDTQTAYQWGDGGVGWPLVETEGLLVIEETLGTWLRRKTSSITIKQRNVSTCWRGVR